MGVSYPVASSCSRRSSVKRPAATADAAPAPEAAELPPARADRPPFRWWPHRDRRAEWRGKDHIARGDRVRTLWCAGDAGREGDIAPPECAAAFAIRGAAR